MENNALITPYDKIKKMIPAALILIAIIATVGTILMFLTSYTDYYYVPATKHYYGYYYYYSPSYSGSYVHNAPEAGAMPLAGTVLIVAAFVFFLLSKKRPYFKAVTASVLIAASTLLEASYAILPFTYEMNDTAMPGYGLCSAAGGLCFILALFIILIYVNERKVLTQNADPNGFASKQESANNND